MKRNTKEDILLASLNLFAHAGYDGVTMRDIAEQVGIRQSSIYKHFEGKQEIFDNLVERMDTEYREKLGEMRLAFGDSDKRAEQYIGKKLSDMAEIGVAMFKYWTQDEYASLFRKMLTIEQYHNSEIADLYDKYFLSGIIHFQSDIISHLVENGFFKQGNYRLMAMEFFGPIFFMITAYDVGQNKDDFEELIREHVKKFGKTHTVSVMED